MSHASIKLFSTSDNSLVPSVSYIGTKTKIKFVGSCLKQDKITYTDKNIVNTYIVYEINLWNYKILGTINLYNTDCRKNVFN